MDVRELDRHYSDPALRAHLADLLALRDLYTHCVAPPDYQPDQAITEAVQLTPAGEALVGAITDHLPVIPTAAAHFAVFLQFHYAEPLVDVDKTDIAKVGRCLSNDICTDRIRYPWVFGREAYDWYFSNFTSYLQHLTYEQTRLLLDATPRGVFQLRRFVIGPLGVLESQALRYLPASRNVPLWHCPSVACEALHHAALGIGTHVVYHAMNFADQYLQTHHRPGWEWSEFSALLTNEQMITPDDYTGDLPPLLADGLSESELSLLLEAVLDTDGRHIRPLLPGTLTGKAAAIVRSADHTTTFQMLLLATDETLISTLEQLIHADRITLPQSEVRRARSTVGTYGRLGEVCECSRLGIRFRPPRRDTRMLRLRRLILDVFAGQDDLLAYRLRHNHGSTSIQRLDEHLQNVPPDAIVRDALFTGPGQLERAAASLRYGHFPQPATLHDEEELVRKVMWKLGFATWTRSGLVTLIRERLTHFQSAVEGFSGMDEQGRERIRSAGVNLFVSLEEVLDGTISFVCWALLEDHYRTSQFVYNARVAREFMASTLISVPGPDGSPIKYDPVGRNTLGPLISGLTGLAVLVTELRRMESDSRCLAVDLPWYYGIDRHETFPFLHRRAMYDMDEDDVERLISTLMEVRSELDRAQVAAIRNALDHHRTDFPTRAQMVEMCDVLSRALLRLEDIGLVPTLSTYAGSARDLYGRENGVVRDHAGRETTIAMPVELRTPGMPEPADPQVVLRGVRVRSQTDRWRFSLSEDSTYQSYWAGYPRRRQTEVNGVSMTATADASP